MYFSEWRKLQRDCGMFNISQSFVAEGISKDDFEKIVHTFLPFVKKELGIKELPKIHFVDDPKFAKRIAAFGQIKDNRIVIDIQGRQTMDILRTVAHELTHYRQHKRGTIGSGHAGSSTENEANKLAGTIVRKFGEKHSGLFQLPSVNEAKKRKRRNMIDIDSEHYPIELS
jgi:translation initiation factor 1 (eIF-1/SUI1)